jgi:hypothetical protein
MPKIIPVPGSVKYISVQGRSGSVKISVREGQVVRFSQKYQYQFREVRFSQK